MDNFILNNRTVIYFGKDTIRNVGELTTELGKSVLLIYGNNSVRKSGVIDIVKRSLYNAGVSVYELPGIRSNPYLCTVYDGIEICRDQHVDCILALGGGSVIDTAKAIAFGVPYSGDVWDFFLPKAEVTHTLPVGVILTVSGSGSESSNSCVITNEISHLKRSVNTDIIRPMFAILDPAITITVPPYQTACGAADALSHVMERYFTATKNVSVTDRLCEGLMKAIIENSLLVIKKPNSYDARAQLMWASKLAHDNTVGWGRTGDYAVHKMAQELSAIYDSAHGATISVMYPAWMKYVFKRDISKFIQFATNVWNVDYNASDPDKTVCEGIRRLVLFYKKLGLPTTLGELDILDDRYDEMALKCVRTAEGTVGNAFALNKKDVSEIYRLAK